MALTKLQQHAILEIAQPREDQIFLDSFHYNAVEGRIEWDCCGRQVFDSREIEWLLRCMKECEAILSDGKNLQDAEDDIRQRAQDEYDYLVKQLYGCDDPEGQALAAKKAILADYGLD